MNAPNIGILFGTGVGFVLVLALVWRVLQARRRERLRRADQLTSAQSHRERRERGN